MGQRGSFLKPPFDIAGDLDTPVSAYAKLASFKPRFLLESVEGGERLGRYSFIGFGDGLEVRLDSRALAIGPETYPVPASKDALLQNACARPWRARRGRMPELPGMPLAGGLVGFTAYDVVRFFEKLPMRHARNPSAPILHYIAPESLLVFDHLTRGIALLHAGSEAERRVLREEVIAALRGRIVLPRAERHLRRPRDVAGARGLHGRRERRAGIHRRGRCVPAGAVVEVLRPAPARSLPGVSRAAADQSLALHVLLQPRRVDRRWAPRPRRW